MTGATPVYTESTFASGAAEVLASLPQSYAAAGSAVGAVVALDGTDGWPDAALHALNAEAVGVIVTNPRPADVAELLRRAAVVAIDSQWAANPAVDEAAQAFSAALPRGTRVECRALLPVGTDASGALLDQLTLMRRLVGPVTDVRVLTRAGSGYAAEGFAEGHPVDLELVCTDAVPATVSVRLLTVDGSVELQIPPGDTARPARLTTTTPAGSTVAPTLFETGHRATWRRVRALLTSSAPTTPADLDDFAADRHTVLTAFPHDEG